MEDLTFPPSTSSLNEKDKEPTPSASSAEVTHDHMIELVREEVSQMANSIMRLQIEKEIEERIAGKQFSTSKRSRIYSKVAGKTKKQLNDVIVKVVESQVKKGSRCSERRINEDIEKSLTECIAPIVKKNMDIVIADELIIQQRKKVKTNERFNRYADDFPKPPGMFGVRHAQVLMILLFLTISFMQRIDLSVVVVAIDKEQTYHWNESVIGMLFSSFYWGYLIMQLPGGILAESYGPKIIMTISMSVCSLASLFVPAATVVAGWVGMFIVKLIQGVSQGTFIPAVYVFTARWIPPSEKATLFTPAFGGMQLGTVIGLPISGLLCETYIGWPLVYFFNAFVGLLWVVFWIFLGANSPAVHRSISREEQYFIESSFGFSDLTLKGAKRIIPWKSILTSVPFLALVITHFCQNWACTTLFMELPRYIQEVLKMNIMDNAFLSAMVYLIGWIFIVASAFASGYIHDRNLLTKGVERKLWNSIAFIGGAITLIVLGLSHTKSVTFAITMLTLFSMTNAFTYNGFFLNHADLSPNYVGVLMGLSNTFGNVSSLLAPVFVGCVVKDPTDPDQWSVVFFVLAGVLVVSNIVFCVFGSAEIQPWNTPQNLHLQLKGDVPTLGSKRQFHGGHGSQTISSKIQVAVVDKKFSNNLEHKRNRSI